MYTNMISAGGAALVKNVEEGVQRVRDSNGFYALLAESTVIDHINTRLPCDTMKVGGTIATRSYGIGLPLHSDMRSVSMSHSDYIATLIISASKVMENKGNDHLRKS